MNKLKFTLVFLKLKIKELSLTVIVPTILYFINIPFTRKFIHECSPYNDICKTGIVHDYDFTEYILGYIFLCFIIGGTRALSIVLYEFIKYNIKATHKILKIREKYPDFKISWYNNTLKKSYIKSLKEKKDKKILTPFKK